MRIFVIHYKKLIDRKLFILSQFKKHNITDYEFIEIERDDLSNPNISMFHKNYKNSQMSLSLKHFYAYKEISDKYDNCLILEDDAILINNFTDILNKYMDQLPKNYDCYLLGMVVIYILKKIN